MTDSTSTSSLPMPVFSGARNVSVELHAHLRRLILDAIVPAGSVLKQAELARHFGVSRTPMREAFRMLQEEGLIDAEVNQRARVRSLDPGELDHLYSVRITLESLGARVTAGSLETSEIERAREMLEEMHRARLLDEIEAWSLAHREFHELCIARADEPLRRIVASYREQSQRYIRVDQLWHPDTYPMAESEHTLILDALVEGDPELAGRSMAVHLARTAVGVLRDVFPESIAIAVPQAIAMTGADPRLG